MLLVSLDAERLPIHLVEKVLQRLYANPGYLPLRLRGICSGLLKAVQHIEAVCQLNVYKARQRERSIVKEVKTQMRKSPFIRKKIAVQVELNKYMNGYQLLQGLPRIPVANVGLSGGPRGSTVDSKRKHSISVVLDESHMGEVPTQNGTNDRNSEVSPLQAKSI